MHSTHSHLPKVFVLVTEVATSNCDVSLCQDIKYYMRTYVLSGADVESGEPIRLLGNEFDRYRAWLKYLSKG
jgi:hypothetical protein